MFYPRQKGFLLDHDDVLKHLRSVFNSPDRFRIYFFAPEVNNVVSDSFLVSALEAKVYEMTSVGERPDQILTIGDYATRLTAQSTDTLINRLPVVFMALEAPEWLSDVIARPNFTGCILPIDFKKNIDFIHDFTGQTLVHTDLVTIEEHTLLRWRIGNQLGDTAEYQFDEDTKDIRYLRGQAVPTALSAYLKTTDRYHSMPPPEKGEFLNFSMTPGRFNPDNRKIPTVVGGYLSPVNVMVEDVRFKIDKIASGLLPSRVPVDYHHADYWIDWSAFRHDGKYASDFPDYVKFVNIPWYEANEFSAWLHSGGWMILLVVFVFWMAITLTLSYIFRYREERRVLKYAEKAEADHRMLASSLATMRMYFWHIENEDILFSDDTVRRLGLRRGRIPLKTFCRLIPDKIVLKNLIRALATDEKDGKTHTYRIEIPAGREGNFHTIDVAINHIELDGQKAAMGTFTVLDERFKVQKEIRQSLKAEEDSQMRESFFASMGHEIRTPINAIVGFSRLLVEQRNELAKEEKEMFVEQIQSNGEQLLNLLDDVMNFSAEEEQLRNAMITIPVEELVVEIYRTHSVIVPRHLQFLLKKCDTPADITVSRTSIRQILSNLINNACKFTPSGSVTLGWEVSETEVCIFVEDTGVGLTEEDLARVFSLYFKKDFTTEGAGIGLSLCSKLARAMGGTLTATSTYGVGSRFMLKLPVK